MALPQNTREIRAAANWIDKSDVSQVKVRPVRAARSFSRRSAKASEANRLRVLLWETYIVIDMMAAIPSSERRTPRSSTTC